MLNDKTKERESGLKNIIFLLRIDIYIFIVDFGLRLSRIAIPEMWNTRLIIICWLRN